MELQVARWPQYAQSHVWVAHPESSKGMGVSWAEARPSLRSERATQTFRVQSSKFRVQRSSFQQRVVQKVFHPDIQARSGLEARPTGGPSRPCVKGGREAPPEDRHAPVGRPTPASSLV